MSVKLPIRLSLLLAVLVLAALACELSPADEAALQTAVAETLEAAVGPTTETPTQAPPTVEPTADASETPLPTATVEHFMVPAAPAGLDRFLTDASSMAYASERRTLGDDFTANRLERPFTSTAMDYQADLDIVRAELDLIDPWVYVTISVEGPVGTTETAIYGVELDIDGDGAGEWLIRGRVPTHTPEWTTDGVQALQDANDDVGGEELGMAEVPLPGGDGYENLVFDSGIGSDPDAAWIRMSPSSPNQVQLAFKTNLIGSVEFLWGVWSDAGPQDPAMYDYHDHFTAAQAGSPIPSHSNYPLNLLASVDNSCLDSFAFPTSGGEPRLCIIPGSIAGVVWKDRCLLTGGEGGEPLVLGDGCIETVDSPFWSSDKVYEPSWEPGIPGVVIDLGSGACPSTGLATDTTDSQGRYGFNGLSAGTYCVTLSLFDHDNGSDLIPGGAVVPHSGDPTTYTINLAVGENRTGVNFGWLFQFGD